MLPLVGHSALRKRLTSAVRKNALPASMLLHGPAGTGKERLALWLASYLLCERQGDAVNPCGECQPCRYASAGAHPDLHWYFPRPRLKDADPDVDDIVEDLNDAIAERVAEKGAWGQAGATDSLYVATIRALVKRAALTPALAKRKVIVVADAERMVSQEGSDQAANAFLKLLEEPLADTNIILTSSVPAALLPTVRSRVAAVRVPPLGPDAVRELATLGVAAGVRDAKAQRAAASLLDAATSANPADRYRQSYAQGASGARGAFSETLEALTTLLHDRARVAAVKGSEREASMAAHGVALVENAKRMARQNVNPQLITADLLARLHR